jgi:hypothetical protein
MKIIVTSVDFVIVLFVLLASSNVTYGTNIYSNATSLSDEYYKDTVRLAEQSEQMNQQVEQESFLTQPNPETNDNITIVSIVYPSEYSDTSFEPYSPTLQINFSKQNVTYLVIDEGSTKPHVSKLPTWFSFNSHIKIPSSDGLTTLIKSVSGWFNIYQVQEYPQANEIHYYGEGTISVEDETWWDAYGTFVEIPGEQYDGIILNGYVLEQ